MEEEKIKGDRDTFYCKKSGSIFAVAFDKIFSQPLIKAHNEFEMNSKRNFRNLVPLILETYKELFLDERESFIEEYAIIFLEMLNGKVNSMIKSPMLLSDFIEVLDKVLKAGDEKLLKRIETYVEENYSLSLDSETEKARERNKKINETLQFTDEHGRTLLKISYLYRVMIPLISVYFTYNKNAFSEIEESIDDEEELDEDENVEFTEMNSKIFNFLFDRMAGKDSENIKNKLYKLVFSRVSKTAYSDKGFWMPAKNVGITIESETLEIYKKLITNVLSKLSIEEDKNVVVFLQSVVNNQINFLLQNKFKYRVTTISNTLNNYENDEDMTEYERMELKQIRFDEGVFAIRKENINDTIAEISSDMDVHVDLEEVQELSSKLKRNSIQEQIVAYLTFKYFQDIQSMKYINFMQYTHLVLCCKKYLEKRRYTYLPIILTAECEKHKERISVSGKRARPEIIASKKFSEIISGKYNFFAEDIEKPFLSFIGTTYCSIFKDENGNEIFDSSVKVTKIAEEICNLAQLI